MKVLSTILALVVLPIGFNSAPAETDLAPSGLPNVMETSVSGLPPLHWVVLPPSTCASCHDPIPGGVGGQSSDLEEVFRSWEEAERLKIGN